jgi:hypothetical protein
MTEFQKESNLLKNPPVANMVSVQSNSITEIDIEPDVDDNKTAKQESFNMGEQMGGMPNDVNMGIPPGVQCAQQ